MIGLQRSTVSPRSSSIRRSTPWVLGCAGPMLMTIVWSSSGAAGISPSLAASASLIRSTEPTSRSNSRAVSSLRGLSPCGASEPLRIVSTIPVAGTTSSAGDVGIVSVTGPPWGGRAELHRDGADRVVLAQWMTLPVLRHEDAGQVRVVVEDDAEHVVHLALHRLRAGVEVEQRRHLGFVARHLHADPQPRLGPQRQQVDDHLEPFGGDV